MSHMIPAVISPAAAVPAIQAEGMLERLAPAVHPVRRLRVMSFNIRHGKGIDGFVDLKRIAADIRSSGADVIALQEVDRYQIRSGFQDQSERLAGMLGMYAAFAPSLKFGPFQYGNAVLSRYPILGKAVVRMRGRTEPRSLLIARIDMEGVTVAVANTHLGVIDKEKDQQMSILLNKLSQLEQPAVLLGDFNMKMSDTRMRRFPPDWQKTKLRDKHPTYRYGGEIDHILTLIHGAKTAAWVQPTDSSDHHPVVAELEWLVKP